MVWLNSQNADKSRVESVLALQVLNLIHFSWSTGLTTCAQAQFERLQTEPEDVLRQSEDQRPPTEKQIGILSTSQEPIYLSQLPESQIQVTPPTRTLTQGPRLIKLQAPRSLDALQPVARPTINKTETPKVIVLKTRESEPLKMARNSVETVKAVFTEKNQWIPSLPGWQRNGPKGLVNAEYPFHMYISNRLFGGTFSTLCRPVEIFSSNNVSYKILEVSPEGLVFTSKARAINELAEIGGRQQEIAALIDMFKLVA